MRVQRRRVRRVIQPTHNARYALRGPSPELPAARQDSEYRRFTAHKAFRCKGYRHGERSGHGTIRRQPGTLRRNVSALTGFGTWVTRSRLSRLSDPETAEEAASLIRVEYEPLPALLDIESAMSDGAFLIHDDFPGNIVPRSTRSSRCRRGVQGCDIVRTDRFVNKRQDGGFLNRRHACAIC